MLKDHTDIWKKHCILEHMCKLKAGHCLLQGVLNKDRIYDSSLCTPRSLKPPGVANLCIATRYIRKQRQRGTHS